MPKTKPMPGSDEFWARPHKKRFDATLKTMVMPDPTSRTVPHPEDVLDEAKRRLDEARDKLASAQTEYIDAERRYNDASHACVAERFPHRDVK